MNFNVKTQFVFESAVNHLNDWGRIIPMLLQLTDWLWYGPGPEGTSSIHWWSIKLCHVKKWKTNGNMIITDKRHEDNKVTVPVSSALTVNMQRRSDDEGWMEVPLNTDLLLPPQLPRIKPPSFQTCLDQFSGNCGVFVCLICFCNDVWRI